MRSVKGAPIPVQIIFEKFIKFYKIKIKIKKKKKKKMFKNLLVNSCRGEKHNFVLHVGSS